MRAVLQVVKSASVWCEEKLIAESGKGLLIFLGIGKDDTETDSIYLCEKILNLRIFEDPNGKMNLSIKDINGEILLVSEFTLFADTRKGRRPSFSDSMPPEEAKHFYEFFEKTLKSSGLKVHSGIFRAHMQVHLINNGPITILMDSKKLF